MNILNKKLKDITIDDIERLVNNEIKETTSLDYKRDWHLSKDAEVKEFLYDITAFYNAEGGYLIYGIEEKKDDKGQNTGIPKSIVGIDIENEDKFIQKIEDIVRSNTEPSITNLAINIIPFSNKYILIIGIKKNLGFPSMVTFNNSNRFYRRRNSGKYLVDVYELNDMFMQNQVLKDKVNEYRTYRIETILNKESFPLLNTNRFCVVHLIPYSFLKDNNIDISSAYNRQINTLIMPMGGQSGASPFYNIDGYAAYDNHTHSAYTQIIRNGALELYTTQLFFDMNSKVAMSGTHTYNSIIESIQNGLQVMQEFKIESPVFIGLYFHNMKDLIFTLDDGVANFHRINYPKISLPFTTLLTYDTDLKSILKPIFDILWQCAGYKECFYK